MPIITISRGSYRHGREVAERVAEKLGYECISRETVLTASDHFNAPEVALFRAAHDGPSVLGRFVCGKEKYVAYARKALLDSVRKDNVVYHGFAGHFFLQGVSHVLKVRIIADMAARVELEASQKGITSQQARKNLEKDDKAHRRWSEYLYGIDNADPQLYDLVIPIHNMGEDDAAEVISKTAASSPFQPTAESRLAMQMLCLAARVQVALYEDTPFAKVAVEGRDIVVTAKGYWSEGKKLMHRIAQILDKEGGSVGLKLKLTSR